MAGHSRPKDGVASLAYVPAIHALHEAKTWMPGTGPGMTLMGQRSTVQTRSLLQSGLKFIATPLMQ